MGIQPIGVEENMPQEDFQLQLRWGPDESPPQYANNMTIAFDGAAYIVRFYAALPSTDLLLNGPSEAEDSIFAAHIVTLVIPEKNFANIVKVISESKIQKEPNAND